MTSSFLRGTPALILLLSLAAPANATAKPFPVVFPRGDVVYLPQPEGAFSLANEQPGLVNEVLSQQDDFGYFLLDALAWIDSVPTKQSLDESAFFDGILIRVEDELAEPLSAQEFEILAEKLISERHRDLPALEKVLVSTPSKMETSIERGPLGPAEVEAGVLEEPLARIEYGDVFVRHDDSFTGYVAVIAEDGGTYRFFVGTATLMRMQSLPVEILILSEIASPDEADGAFEEMQRVTDEWIGRVSAQSRKRLPPIDFEKLKRYRSPVHLVYMAGDFAWAIIGSGLLALTLILGIPGRGSGPRDLLVFLPWVVGSVLTSIAVARGQSAYLEYVGPFRPGYGLELVSSIWTEALALPILGAMTTLVVIGLIVWARRNSQPTGDPNESSSTAVE